MGMVLYAIVGLVAWPFQALHAWYVNCRQTRQGRVLVEIGMRDPIFGVFLPMGPTHAWVHEDTLSYVRAEHKRCYNLIRPEVDKVHLGVLAGVCGQGARDNRLKVLQTAYDEYANCTASDLIAQCGMDPTIANALVKKTFSLRFC